LKQSFLGTTKFGVEQKIGATDPECPRVYGPATHSNVVDALTILLNKQLHAI